VGGAAEKMMGWGRGIWRLVRVPLAKCPDWYRKIGGAPLRALAAAHQQFATIPAALLPRARSRNMDGHNYLNDFQFF
jgi:hypothetical protein